MHSSFKVVPIAFAVASTLGAQQQPSVRQLGAVTAAATEPLGANVFVRPVANGVLVNDVQNRRLLMFDAQLKSFTVVADTTPATANAYSGRIASLIAYRGDSSLFVDPQSLSMLVIDPAGKVTRVMSVPRSQDAMTLGNSMFGTPTFDASGKLVYRGFPRPNFRGEQRTSANGSPNFTPPEMPDSTPVMRIDLATRQVDTVAFVKVPKVKMDVQRDDNGRVMISAVVNPLPMIDDWAVLSDGSIALVRGRDYHVDWVRPDGTRESSAKIPFDWRRLSDEDKVAFIDSVKAARARMAALTPANAATAIAGGAAGGGNAGGPPGEIRIMVGPGGAPGGPGGPGGGPGMGGREPTFVAPSELPDYQPVFFAGAVRADADGRLWVRTTPTRQLAGGPIYDVIDRTGALVERVQVPKDRVIVGFAPGGVVYLVARDGTVGKLERANLK